MSWNLVVVETHPIQYKAPLFCHLHADPEIELTVLYAMVPDSTRQGDGFGVAFSWDVPLLEGYPYEVLENRSKTPSVLRFDGCDTPGVYAYLKDAKPDAVLVNGWVVKTCLQTLWACKRLKIPCMVRGEANLRRRRARWKERIQGLLVRRYAACLAIGDANRDFYLQRGVSADRIFDAPYCVDNEFFFLSSQKAKVRISGLRRKWNLPEGALVLLFVGKFETKKHPDHLLDAIAKVPGNVHLLMVGDGEMGETLQSRAADLSVTFAGFLNQSEITDAYAVSDVLVLPSDAGETWGLVANEAMACGLTVVVSDKPGCAGDLVVDGRTGRVVPFGDVDRLAEVLAELANDRGKVERLSLSAQKTVAKYDYAAVAKGVKQALRKVTG